VTRTGAPASLPARSPGAARVAEWLWAAPVLGIVAYAVVLATRVPSLVEDTATSDSVGPMVIAQSLPAPAGSRIVMGNAAHYTTLWIDALTRHLPDHRAVWAAWPYVLALLSLLLLTETVRRLAGGRAALVAFAIGMATPALLLVPLLSQAFHETTFANGIVLGVLLTAMGASARVRASLLLVGVSALVAVVTGLDVASDPLLLVTGVAPFVASAALVAWLRRDRHAVEVVVAAAATAVAALAIAGAAVLVQRHAGFDVEGLPLSLAGASRMHDNATLLGHLVLAFDNGHLSLHDLGDLGPLRLACGVLAVVAALVPLWFLLRVAMRRLPGRHDAAESTLPRHDATALWLAYWGLVAVFLAIAFVATTLPVDRNSVRYLLPGFYAIAATVPFLTLRTAARAAAVAVAVAFTGVVGAVLLHRAGPDDFDVQPQQAAGLIAALESHGLHYGYAGYWQANLLTWQSDGRVVSRAVQQGDACHAAQKGWFCPYPIFTVSDWYTAQNQPTFLIRELGGSFVPDPPPAQPRPASVFSYDRFEVYVYDHDIGADAARSTTGWPIGQSITP
jgi:hypothetical protein